MVKNPSPLQGFEIQIQNMLDFWIFFKSENPIHPTMHLANSCDSNPKGYRGRLRGGRQGQETAADPTDSGMEESTHLALEQMFQIN